MVQRTSLHFAFDLKVQPLLCRNNRLFCPLKYGRLLRVGEARTLNDRGNLTNVDLVEVGEDSVGPVPEEY